MEHVLRLVHWEQPMMDEHDEQLLPELVSVKP
jgi:hypothetical protein